MPTTKELIEFFSQKWDLSTWANVLEVLGTTVTCITFVFAIFLNKRITELKRRVLFHKTITQNQKMLAGFKGALNAGLTDYPNNMRMIETTIHDLHVELKILKQKVRFRDSFHLRILIIKCWLINNKELVPSVKRLKYKFFESIYIRGKADSDDVWKIYHRLRGIIRRNDELKIETPTI